MLMSHSPRSASVTGLPRPGRSAAAAAPSPNARGMTTARPLRIYMLGLPFGVDGPTRYHVHVTHRESGNGDIDLGLAALRQELAAGRLHIARLIPGAALQH